MKRAIGIFAAAAMLFMFLTGCSDQKKDEINEDFKELVTAFEDVFLPMDEDGYIYQQALEAAEDYLDGDMDKEEALNIVADAILTIDETINSSQEISLDSDLQVILEKYNILPEEFELFMNFRTNDLDAYSNNLKFVYPYLQSAYMSDRAEDEAVLVTKLYLDMQECNEGYFYYANLNYWFTDCEEKEVDYLLDSLSDKLKWLSVDEDDFIWENSMSLVEEKCMVYIYMLEDYLDFHAELVNVMEDKNQSIDDMFTKLEELSEQNGFR